MGVRVHVCVCVCVVVHAIEKGYLFLIIVIIEHSTSKMKPMHTLSLQEVRTCYVLLWI